MNTGFKYLLFFSLCFLLSCKKDNEKITIKGQIREKHSGNPLEQVKVTIWANGVIQGVYQANFTWLNNTYSLPDGSFTMEIDEGKYDNLRMEFFKSGFFKEYLQFNATQIIDNSFTAIQNMEAIMNVFVHVKNQQPIDDSDRITLMFDKLRNETNCCGNKVYQFTGKMVDTVIHCLSVKYFPVVIHKVIEKNQQVFITVDSILTVSSDTIWWNILY